MDDNDDDLEVEYRKGKNEESGELEVLGKDVDRKNYNDGDYRPNKT